MNLTLSLACLLLSQLLPAQTADWQSVERAKILEGLDSVPKLGSPGPIALWGEFAFPVLAAGDGEEAELALCAAAGYGKGRAIIFGHNAYLTGDGPAGTLLANAVRWAGNKERPKVGLMSVDLAGFFERQNMQVAEIIGPLNPQMLNDCDVVVANVQGITDDEEGLAIREFIKKGGGFVAAMTGWAYEQTSGGRTLSSSHGLNKGLLPLGLSFTDGSGFSDSSLTSFSARPELPRFLNAFEAIKAMKRQQSGGPALNPDEVNQGANAIQLAMAAQPPGRTSLQAAVLESLGEGKAAVPTPEKPLNQIKDTADRIRLGMETRVLRLAGSVSVAAHPAAKIFPGLAPSEAPRVTKEITVTPSVSGWTSTGLWTNAGEPITVTMPENMSQAGYSLRIGCHTDTLYHLDDWLRAPEITRSMGLTAPVTKTSSAFGGLIYIEVPGSASSDKPFPVKIEGAVEAPYFVLGKDTDATWNDSLKKKPAPWAELACDKMILSVPSDVAKKIKNPAELMTFWKAVVEAQDDFANQAAERRGPERMVCDVQISAGYMHSGYPIMAYVSTAEEMTTYSRLKFPEWGFYHEIGHNHQRETFTFQGTGEVTNNVLAMYVYEAVLGKSWLSGHPALSGDSRKENLATIKAASDKWQTWKSNPFLALDTYIQLIETFGWESMKTYLHSFDDPAFGPPPGNDDDARDQFLVRYSKITKSNLGPFFDAWGIPVSSAAKAEVEKFDVWMPKGM